ncbi:MAG: hypothetical protein PVH46_00950 [Granulosicoccaceae bacterium]|jgi:hypothetical protein
MNKLEFDEMERAMLANCENSDSTRRRMGSVLFSSLTFIILLSYAHFALSADIVFAIMLVYVAITTVEKLLYGKGVLAYKRLIDKLYQQLAMKD